jgi:hypothetical protein
MSNSVPLPLKKTNAGSYINNKKHGYVPNWIGTTSSHCPSKIDLATTISIPLFSISLLLIKSHSSSQNTTSTYPTSPPSRYSSSETPPQPPLCLSIFQKLFVPSLIPNFLLFHQFHFLFIIPFFFTRLSPLLDLLRTCRNRR